MRYILSFDIPRESPNLKLRVNRALHRIGAKLVHHSLWRHADMKMLADIAVEIKENGGRAVILEERLLF